MADILHGLKVFRQDHWNPSFLWSFSPIGATQYHVGEWSFIKSDDHGPMAVFNLYYDALMFAEANTNLGDECIIHEVQYIPSHHRFLQNFNITGDFSMRTHNIPTGTCFAFAVKPGKHVITIHGRCED